MTSHDRSVVFALRLGWRAGGRSSERAEAARKAAGRAQGPRRRGESTVCKDAERPDWRSHAVRGNEGCGISCRIPRLRVGLVLVVGKARPEVNDATIVMLVLRRGSFRRSLL